MDKKILMELMLFRKYNNDFERGSRHINTYLDDSPEHREYNREKAIGAALRQMKESRGYY